MDTGCSDAESSSSHGVSWSNLTTPCCVQGSRQRHYSRSHDLQNENVLLLAIFQTYGVSSRHDGHSYVCSMGLWFLLHTVCCNCCKRSDTQHSLLCSLCSVSVLQWPQKMTSQCQQRITSAGTVKSSSGATVRLRQNTDCTTENVVYLISCSSCNKQYVGETKGPLNKRMNGHRDDWRHRRFERSPTAEHFHSADHDFLSNASVCCLEHNKEWSDSTRKLRESYWIRRLNTLCPFGINKGD